MFKLLRIFTWLVLGMVVLGCLDQFLLRVPLDAPGLSQAQTFYVDFRSRLLGLVGIETARTPASIEQLIDAGAVSDRVSQPKRYLYADESGTLHFADSLQQVPARYRKDAQPLAE